MSRAHPAIPLYVLAAIVFNYDFAVARLPIASDLVAAGLAAVGVLLSTALPDARLSRPLLKTAGFGALIVLTATVFLPFLPGASTAVRLSLAPGGALAFACLFLAAGGTAAAIASD